MERRAAGWRSAAPRSSPDLVVKRARNPTDNAFAAVVNERLRAEYLNAHWRLGLADGRCSGQMFPIHSSDLHSVFPFDKNQRYQKGRAVTAALYAI